MTDLVTHDTKCCHCGKPAPVTLRKGTDVPDAVAHGGCAKEAMSDVRDRMDAMKRKYAPALYGVK